ncbi:MAG: Fis family transcriptional regulator [Gammaproteobacteria bacterium]|nr:MAG: Fis family transcriptional regulator [Gammaproteobacteria bacterium]RLA60744.1 MAG: Fis family transcriptional regulator [Gammaproteobacteria bacterium]
MLDSYEHPAILVTSEYRILATNDLYKDKFDLIDTAGEPARCYEISHGYDRPCDQAGEDCPLAAAIRSGQRERVLHIHQTPRGEEHVDVEMLPILDAQGVLQFFVELLKPVPIAGAGGDKPMVGASPSFNRMLELITRVGPTNAAVLLLGESGTGKELAARTLHQTSLRSQKSLVTLECAGLSETLFESELFGHVKGAFTGANYTRQGLAEAAHGGTLFLDEIGDIPYPLQVKLLRLIETGTYRPVGSTVVKQTDFRLVCATHRNLQQMVEVGEFRQDLYYRINVFPIHMPSLGERLEDLPLLARTMLQDKDGNKVHHLTESAVRVLKAHRYRGNIRELRNILSRAVVLANTNVIDPSVIRQCLDIGVGTVVSPDTSLKAAEEHYLEQLMRSHHNDKEKVAAIAGISVRSLYRKLQESRG